MDEIERYEVGDMVLILGAGRVQLSEGPGEMFEDIDLDGLRQVIQRFDKAIQDLNDGIEYLVEGIEYLEEQAVLDQVEGDDDDYVSLDSETAFDQAREKVFDAFTPLYREIDPTVDSGGLISAAETAAVGALRRLFNDLTGGAK